LLFILPIGKISKIKINADFAKAEKVDERETMFARAELKSGTNEYKQYYLMRPENQKNDDKIRSMTNLLEEGGKYFDEQKSETVKSLFLIEESRINEVDGEVSDKQEIMQLSSATKPIKSKCLELGADEVGIALLNPNYIYSHQARGTKPWGTEIVNHHKYVIAFTVEMDFNEVAKAPRIDITVETARKYLKAQDISISLAKYIRGMGYPARAHVSGSNYEIMLPPVAYSAGLGELGRMNYLISKKFGGRIRLGAVTTDLPLDIDKPIAFGVQDFCESCMKCAENCPSGAIAKNDKTEIRGIEKWDFNVEQCYSYWRYLGTDCGLCMKVCPFSHKDNLIHNFVRFGISKSSFARKVSLWGDDLIYGKKIDI